MVALMLVGLYLAVTKVVVAGLDIAISIAAVGLPLVRMDFDVADSFSFSAVISSDLDSPHRRDNYCTFCTNDFTNMSIMF